MTRPHLLRLPLAVLFLAGILVPCLAQDRSGGTAEDSVAIARTGDAIRAAFASGDVDAIMAYHHPDVVKALSSRGLIVGREALRNYLETSFRSMRVEFTENRVEDLLITGDAAVEISAFTIRVTPKNGDAPSLFKGRAMVVYVRYKPSSTGWASIREVIQPAT
jgi:ketosteroid isomerase-like protein